MERSIRSEETLNTRMKHEYDDGVNKDSNLSRLEPHSVRASIKEDSQRTTTLTDNKKETTKTKDLQCMKTHALASTTLTCSPSVSGHFAHCWVSLCTSCRQFKRTHTHDHQNDFHASEQKSFPQDTNHCCATAMLTAKIFNLSRISFGGSAYTSRLASSRSPD